MPVMTANQALLLLVVTVWGCLAAAVKASNLLGGKRWSDGPSLIPIIPLFPAIALGVGYLINAVASPWGTWAIAAAHLTLLVVACLRYRRPGYPPPNGA